MVDTDDEAGPSESATSSSSSAAACSSSSPLQVSSCAVQKTKWADLADSDDDSAKPGLQAPELMVAPEHRPEQDQLAPAALQNSVQQRSRKPPRSRRAPAAGPSAAGARPSAWAQSDNRWARGGWAPKPQCQFFIGIEEEPTFQVKSRVLGPHGQHMKTIAKATGAKLRLRGRGSGFLEGEEQAESTDELMLCVSTQDWASYQEAVRRVSKLLTDVYRQYDAFARKAGLVVRPLAVSMHEGPRPGSR
eukprot:SRR837773.9796.p1 GENE.SRR837773.9796~~SRR837773.9796.p1  ORF type:complete len:257 (+),score=39.98 SRR837773.9796:32-772(+)